MADFNVTPQTLGQLNGLNPSYFRESQDWLQRGTRADEVGLAEITRKAAHERAMDPGRIAQQRATLESTQAGTAGQLLKNTDQSMDNDLKQHLLPQSKIQGFKDLLFKGSEQDHKMAEFEIDKMLRSGDPKQMAYGKQLLDVSRKSHEERRKSALDLEAKKTELDIQGKQRMREIGAQGANALAVANVNASAKTKAADIAAASRKAMLDAGGNPKKWQELAVGLSVEVRTEKDPEAKAALNKELQFAQEMAERLGPVPQPVVDPARIPGAPLVPGRPTMPSAPTSPNQVPKPVVNAPPPGAIQMLESNPALRAKFEDKYGPGSAAAVLGQ